MRAWPAFLGVSRGDVRGRAPNVRMSLAHVSQGSKPLVVKFAEGLQQRMEEKTLYVTNLPLEMEEGEISELFQPYGDLRQARLLRNADDNFSKGIAHIRYASRIDQLARGLCATHAQQSGAAHMLCAAHVQCVLLSLTSAWTGASSPRRALEGQLWVGQLRLTNTSGRQL